MKRSLALVALIGTVTGTTLLVSPTAASGTDQAVTIRLGTADPAGVLPGPTAVSRQLSDPLQAPDGVARYWTQRRMASAMPAHRLPHRAPDVAAIIDRALGGAGVGQGRPERVPDAEPDQPSRTRKGKSSAARQQGNPWTSGGAVASTTGRLFFTQAGHDYVCSGSAIRSGNHDVVLTAGHCLHDGYAWSRRVVFIPGYDNGRRPSGTFRARRLVAPSAWTQSGDPNYDVGFAVTRPRNGAHLTDTVGGQGITFNQPRGQYMYAFGYPSARPYSGGDLVYCAGSVRNDPFGTNAQGMDCRMTSGASGGPWFAGFNTRTGRGLANSVTSFGYGELSGMMFGPYFGDVARQAYQRASSL
ncbi:MAG: trypsin-like serine peptidase [Carbonactinosporaceae bacterium]